MIRTDIIKNTFRSRLEAKEQNPSVPLCKKSCKWLDEEELRSNADMNGRQEEYGMRMPLGGASPPQQGEMSRNRNALERGASRPYCTYSDGC
jgi:hypothetical protein